MDIAAIVEEINKLIEDEFVDEFPVVPSPETTDNTENLTDTLNAKTKISRALDTLKDAIEDFKSATAEEVDLINDSDLVASFEALDKVVADIASVLPSASATIKDTEEISNDQEEAEVEKTSDNVDNNEADNDEELLNFDDQAELDLFNVDSED